MKKPIAKFLTLSLVLSSVVAFAPVPGQADVVSAATGTTTTTPAKTTTTKTTTTTAAPVATVAGDVYTVVKGDAFWKIAKKFNLTVDALAKLNPQVKNINKIAVGQQLTVKAAATATTTPAPAAKKLYHGLGEVANYRDRNGNPNDQLNFTTASVIFDEDGKIVQLTWDVMEVTAAMFPGWLEAKLDKAKVAEYQKTVDDVWETKTEEGYNYGMKKSAVSGKEWFEQLDFFENYFKGWTVEAVEAWVNKYTDPVNRRPYKMAYPEKLTEADKKVTDTFSAEEKKMLVDVTTSATMSLQDGHSHFISALKEAYAKRQEIK